LWNIPIVDKNEYSGGQTGNISTGVGALVIGGAVEDSLGFVVGVEVGLTGGSDGDFVCVIDGVAVGLTAESEGDADTAFSVEK